MTYLTITGKKDGFGAQYISILSGIAYCIFKKYTYVHTPFVKMAHGTDVKKANAFIGIKTNSVDISCNIIKHMFVEEVHWSETPSIYYTNKVLDHIRKCYYSSKKPNINSVDIAIHVRRGDVPGVKHMNRYVADDVYKKIIGKLKEKYPEYTITIFSEGSYKDFNDYGLEETCFRLNTDIFETFHSFVSSKVLIMGRSCLSYSAGLINSNIVYHCDPLPYKKLDHWLKISDLIGEKFSTGFCQS
jgi:hypothetical protein